MSGGLEGYAPLMERFAALREGGPVDARLLRSFGTLGVQYAKGEAHRFRKTGNLERSIRVGEVDVEGRSVTIVAGGIRRAANQHARYDGAVGYAAHVEFGTRPHVIRAKRAKALAWGGARRLSGSLRSGAKPTHYARSVNHPGTRAKPYLVPGAERALREVGLADAVVSAWNRAA